MKKASEIPEVKKVHTGCALCESCGEAYSKEWGKFCKCDALKPSKEVTKPRGRPKGSRSL